MQCLRKFYSWLYLRWLWLDVLHMIWLSGKKQNRKEEKKAENVIEGLVEKPTVWTDMETGFTSYM